MGHATRTGQLLLNKNLGYVLYRQHVSLTFRVSELIKKCYSIQRWFEKTASKSILENCEQAFRDKIKDEQIKATFEAIYKLHGDCTGFDLAAPDAMESAVVFKFADAAKLNARIKIAPRTGVSKTAGRALRHRRSFVHRPSLDIAAGSFLRSGTVL